MSNLKKVVSLVLVVVMVFAMGASSIAAFSDASDINFKDEVNLLSALGILSGYPDGSFKPTGTVTRAEYAKMLFMVKLGHLDASGFVNATTTFQDLEAAAWAKGYIKYLYNVGVVAGKNAAQFDPNGQVTGYEAVKMLLVALGYKAENAGLVGERWKVNTLSLGQERGLLDGYNIDFDAPCTRELASLLITNGLDAVCVKYSGLSLDGSGNLTTDVIDETRVENGVTMPLTLGYKAFGLYHETGVITATEHLSTKFEEVWSKPVYAADGVTIVTPAALTGYTSVGKTKEDFFTLKSNGGNLTKDTEVNIKFENFDESLFGQEVVVAYKKATNGDNVAYGITATGKSKVYESKIVDTKYASSKLTIKDNGTKYEFKASELENEFANVIYFDNNSDVQNASVSVKTLFAGSYNPVTDTPVFGENLRLPGTVYAIDSDDNGKLDQYYVLASAFGRVDTYNESDRKFNLYGTGFSVKFEDSNFKKVSGDFKVADYAFAYLRIDEGIDVVPAEKLNVKVTKTTSDNVYVGDTAYYGYLTYVKPGDFSFNSTYTIYTDGTFIARQGVDSSEPVSVDNIALAVYIETNLKQVKLLNAKGDEDIYTYSNTNSDDLATDKILDRIVKATTGAAPQPMLVKTSFDSSGRVKLSMIEDDDIALTGGAYTTYNDDDKTINYGTSGKIYLDDSSKVFVALGVSKYDVFTKSGIKNFTGAASVGNDAAKNYSDSAYSAVVYRTTSSGYRYVVAAFILLDSADSGWPAGTATDKYVFATSNPQDADNQWSNSDGKYFQIKGYCDGASVTYVSEKGLTLPSTLRKYSWVKVTLNGDGEIKSISHVGGVNYLTASEKFEYNSADADRMFIGAIKGFDPGYETVTLYAIDATYNDSTLVTHQKEYYTFEVDKDTKYYIMNTDGSMRTATMSDLTRADEEPNTNKYYTNCFIKAKGTTTKTAEIVVVVSSNRCSSIDSTTAFQW